MTSSAGGSERRDGRPLTPRDRSPISDFARPRVGESPTSPRSGEAPVLADPLEAVPEHLVDLAIQTTHERAGRVARTC
jgi:hypothetical protein